MLSWARCVCPPPQMRKDTTTNYGWFTVQQYKQQYSKWQGEGLTDSLLHVHIFQRWKSTCVHCFQTKFLNHNNKHKEGTEKKDKKPKVGRHEEEELTKQLRRARHPSSYTVDQGVTVGWLLLTMPRRFAVSRLSCRLHVRREVSFIVCAKTCMRACMYYVCAVCGRLIK